MSITMYVTFRKFIKLEDNKRKNYTFSVYERDDDTYSWSGSFRYFIPMNREYNAKREGSVITTLDQLPLDLFSRVRKAYPTISDEDRRA